MPTVLLSPNVLISTLFPMEMSRRFRCAGGGCIARVSLSSDSGCEEREKRSEPAGKVKSVAVDPLFVVERKKDVAQELRMRPQRQRPGSSLSHHRRRRGRHRGQGYGLIGCRRTFVLENKSVAKTVNECDRPPTPSQVFLLRHQDLESPSWRAPSLLPALRLRLALVLLADVVVEVILAGEAVVAFAIAEGSRAVDFLLPREVHGGHVAVQVGRSAEVGRRRASRIEADVLAVLFPPCRLANLGLFR